MLIAILSSCEENSDHHEVIEHIELCQQCQQRFDELAACKQYWTKARQALLKERTYEVIVVRQDFADKGSQQRSTSSRIKLAAYRNDILNALMASGGLPGVNAKDEIKILRASKATQEKPNDFVAEFYQTNYAKTDSSRCPPLPDHPDILKIPMRLPKGVLPSFRPEDIILEEGDVVSVELRDRKASPYYVGEK